MTVLLHAHMADVRPGSDHFVIACRGYDMSGCSFGGRYPTRNHARAVADEHIISTHRPHDPADKGERPPWMDTRWAHCPGCDAERRKARRS